jgi:hypothetical protein
MTQASDRKLFPSGKQRRVTNCFRESGRELLTLKANGTTVGDGYFSPDGHTIWAGLDEQRRLWGWDGSPVAERDH